MAERLSRLSQLTVASTGQFGRFVIFGSFVTAKAEPNDVHIVRLMEDTFDSTAVTGEAPGREIHSAYRSRACRGDSQQERSAPWPCSGAVYPFVLLVNPKG